MDEVTKGVLDKLAAQYPGHRIRLTHQFLDGEQGRACGRTPIENCGGRVEVVGQWWKPNQSTVIVSKSQE